MGISKSTAIRDVDRALSKCVERTKAEVDRIKAETLAQNELVKAEAWRGWRRSMQEDVSESQTDSNSDKGCYSSTTTTRTRGKGDPRYLAQVTKCLEFECKLLGVLDSQRDAGNSQRGPMVQFVEIVVENRQQRDEILTFDEFKARRQSHAS